jgi:hypothetical protein
MKQRTARHGHTRGRVRTPEYRSWSAMMGRCYQPKTGNFKYYGGAGIRVCARWHDFLMFLVDVGPRPDGTSLDRIDGARGYEPGNVRWATPETQNNNKVSVTAVSIGGVTQSVSRWARTVGITPRAFRARMRRGWSEAALLTPMSTSPWTKRVPMPPAPPLPSPPLPRQRPVNLVGTLPPRRGRTPAPKPVVAAVRWPPRPITNAEWREVRRAFREIKEASK